jgi:AraC-like DNA-binding protein
MVPGVVVLMVPGALDEETPETGRMRGGVPVSMQSHAVRAPMVEVLSTASAAPAHRFDLWREHVRKVCGALDVRADRGRFANGSIVSSRFGELRMSLISADAHAVSRSSKVADDGHLYVSTPLHGRITISQDGNDTTVRPGEVVSFDSTRPYTLASREPMRLAAVRFPHEAMGLTSGSTHRLTAHPWPGTTGVGALVSTMFTTLAAQLTELSGAERAPLGGTIGGLITSLFAERLTPAAGDPHVARQMVMLRVQAFAREHLADRAITPATLARQHNISLRYLQLLFAEQDTSPARWLRDERLARCRDELADPRYDHLTVAAIGARWGLGGASQMSRLFRRRYGVAPSDFRRQRAELAVA